VFLYVCVFLLFESLPRFSFSVILTQQTNESDDRLRGIDTKTVVSARTGCDRFLTCCGWRRTRTRTARGATKRRACRCFGELFF